MLPIVEALIPVFFLVALGLYMRRSGLLAEEHWTGIETLSYWLFFPALIFDVMIKADLTGVPLGGMTATLVCVVISAAVILLTIQPVLRSAFGMDGPSYTSIYQGVLRWNGFIALAIVQKLYGNDSMALVAVAMAAMIPLINIIVVGILATFAASKKPNIKAVLLNIASNPLILSSLGGLAFNLLQVPIPDAIGTTIDVTGRAALATSLLAVGAGLRLRYTFPPNKDIWIGTLVRLIGMPLLTIGFAKLFGLEGQALEVAVICTAVPTAMNGYILAKKMGGNAPLLAAIVTLQTAISAITIPAFLLMLQ